MSDEPFRAALRRVFSMLLQGLMLRKSSGKGKNHLLAGRAGYGLRKKVVD
jgi:hypothetical protein